MKTNKNEVGMARQIDSIVLLCISEVERDVELFISNANDVILPKRFIFKQFHSALFQHFCLYLSNIWLVCHIKREFPASIGGRILFKHAGEQLQREVFCCYRWYEWTMSRLVEKNFEECVGNFVRNKQHEEWFKPDSIYYHPSALKRVFDALEKLSSVVKFRFPLDNYDLNLIYEADVSRFTTFDSLTSL